MNKSTFDSLKVLSRSFALGGVKIAAVVKGRQLALAAIAAAFSAVAVAAVLTPGAGVISAPVFARASFANPTDIKFKVKDLLSGRVRREEVIDVNNAQETVIQQVVIASPSE